jgi:hypothetical protein
MRREGIIRFLGVVILSLLFASFSGMYSWLQLQKYRARKEAKAIIINSTAPEQIRVLAYPQHAEPAGLRWIHEDEFEWNGSLYDVISVETRNDSVLLHVWEDRKETALNLEIRTLTRRLVQANSEVPDEETRWVQFLKQLMPAPELMRFRGLPEYQEQALGRYKEYFESAKATPPSPPPKQAGLIG